MPSTTTSCACTCAGRKLPVELTAPDDVLGQPAPLPHAAVRHRAQERLLLADPGKGFVASKLPWILHGPAPRSWRVPCRSSKTRVLNRILMYEMAAASTYERLLSQSGHYEDNWPLHGIAEDHRQAIGRLMLQISALGQKATAVPRGLMWNGIQRDPQKKLHEDLRVPPRCRTSTKSASSAPARFILAASLPRLEVCWRTRSCRCSSNTSRRWAIF